MAARYAYVWVFDVAPGAEPAFLRHYAPGGSWAQLFRRAPGYVGTLLLRDSATPGRFVTVDRWESEASYQAFRRDFAQEYAALDRDCADVTLRETPFGSFREVVP